MAHFFFKFHSIPLELLSESLSERPLCRPTDFLPYAFSKHFRVCILYRGPGPISTWCLDKIRNDSMVAFFLTCLSSFSNNIYLKCSWFPCQTSGGCSCGLIPGTLF